MLALWVERVRERILPAQRERTPVLIDTLPAFLNFLAQALSSQHPRTSASEGNSVPEEHGGERARVTRFRLEDVMQEYQLLRDVLLEVLSEDGPLEEPAREVIMKSLDKAISEACAAYMLVHRSIREQFTLTLTHDLRNPLTAAKSSASLILRRSENPEVTRWAARVVENIDRADAMIRDLLDASRLREGEPLSFTFSVCDLREIARQAVAHLQSAHGDQFLLVAPEPIVGSWSEEGLRRAIENLGNNAVKYGSHERPITLSVRQAHGRALISVHNHGSYIPVEERGTLFQTFLRSPSAQRSGVQGWGIGLTLVRGVAEAHRGSVTVDSLPETGTTFLIDLPVAPSAEGSPPPLA